MLLLLEAKKVPKPGGVGLRNFQKTVDVLHHKLEIGWGQYEDEEVNIISDAGLGADEDSRFVEFYDTRVSSEMFQPYHSSDLEFSGMRRSIRPTATPGPARRGYGHRLRMASDVISYDNDGYSGREGRGSRGNRGGRGGGRGRGWNGERDRRNGFDDDHNNFRGGPAGGGPGGPYNNNNQGYDARGPGPGLYGVGGYNGGSGPGPGNYGAPSSGSASRANPGISFHYHYSVSSNP
ncbi:hypothetical protein B0H14DRAFT_2565447 [Mycena olivaceomarginata]|nr:hypothetical protein B0H14DRAFT_2565447 [Mycena olivaceomarginata]